MESPNIILACSLKIYGWKHAQPNWEIKKNWVLSHIRAASKTNFLQINFLNFFEIFYKNKIKKILQVPAIIFRKDW